MRKVSNKAQEEIIGFVLIIVLIAVISLVFLGLQLTKKQEAVESSEVENILGAMLSYTTDCSVYPPAYESFADLIKSCYKGLKCRDGSAACQSLNELSQGMLNATLPSVEGDRLLNAYQLNISYSTTQYTFGRKSQADLVSVLRGRCKGSILSAKEILPIDSGNIEIILKLCY
ncbi:MAG: hypothetical protein V1886_03145 [archaeon]